MKQLVCKVKLFAIFIFFNSISYAQNTWNWVGQDNDNKVINFAVNVLNNKIYTTSSTINWGDSIPYVNSNLIQFDFNGNLIYDSLCGNLNQTFVLYENIRSNYNLGNFCFPVVFRHPNNPALGEKPGVLILDTLYNNQLSYIIPIDTLTTYNRPAYINKIASNKFVLIKSVIISNFEASVLSVFDSLGGTQQSKLFGFSNFQAAFPTFHHFENNYYLILNKSFNNMLILFCTSQK